jgi:NAD(P)-dependent dehydrogenase (short-subunit alcohol dehydrogenase family)
MSWADESLRGRAVIVTGASSGIGRGVAEAMGAEGARVLLQGRDERRLADAAAAVATAGGESWVATCDLASDEGPALVVDTALAGPGAIDVIVHCAGIFEPMPFADTPLDAFDRQLRVNVRAPFELTQRALPHLEPGSVVLFVSSIAGSIGFPQSAAYCASKGAVELLTRSLACELAPDIRIACVAPGNTRTPMNAWQFEASAEYEQSLVDQTPAGKIGDVEEIVPAVVFLASRGARFVHGATLLVDGGWTAR